MTYDLLLMSKKTKQWEGKYILSRIVALHKWPNGKFLHFSSLLFFCCCCRPPLSIVIWHARMPSQIGCCFFYLLIYKYLHIDYIFFPVCSEKIINLLHHTRMPWAMSETNYGQMNGKFAHAMNWKIIIICCWLRHSGMIDSNSVCACHALSLSIFICNWWREVIAKTFVKSMTENT